MVAALIGRADAKSFMVNGECAVKPNFPVPQCRSDSGGLRNPQTSAHLPGIDPGPHNGVGPGSIGTAQSAKASSMVLMLFLLSLLQPVEVTGHQVHLFVKHHWNTWVIKSWRRWLLRGSPVASPQIETNILHKRGHSL